MEFLEELCWEESYLQINEKKELGFIFYCYICRGLHHSTPH